MVALSAIVIAKNEENLIGPCLNSLMFADEVVVVVDSETTDHTVKIAKTYTKYVIVQNWMGYGRTREFAVGKTRGEWILWLDADEQVSSDLASEIKEIIQSDKSYAGYQMPRKAYFLGRWIRHGGWYPGYVIRLFRKDRGTFSDSRVHERLEVDGRIGVLKHPILHFTDNTIYHYFQKWNIYTSLAAEDLVEKRKCFSAVDLFFRPVFMFLKMYLLRFGWLDGMEGFLLSIFSANYVFTKYAKLWEQHRNQKHEIKNK